MNYQILFSIFVLFTGLLFGQNSRSIIIDHTRTDLNAIPAQYIEAIKSSGNVLHYCTRSHGGQLLVGADLHEINNPLYTSEYNYCKLAAEKNNLGIWLGMNRTSTAADGYWDSEAGRTLLDQILTGRYEDTNKRIAFSMWLWEDELNTWTEQQVKDYLTDISALEVLYKDVVFIYCTGSAAEEGLEGYNRFLRNEQIRNYCRANKKVLFDFESIETWRNGKRNMTHHNGNTFPSRCPEYAGRATYAGYESSKKMAYSVWNMMSKFYGFTNWTPGQEMVIDYTCVDSTLLDPVFLDSVKISPNVFHLVTRSRGEQITEGLTILQNEFFSHFDPRYFISIGDCNTTWGTGSFEIWKGMSMNAYVEANHYYASPEGRTELDKILTQNPSIKYTMFSWCGEMDWYSPELVQAYCHILDSLDNHYQNVTFIYMTGNAQTGWPRYGNPVDYNSAATRFRNNNIIRQFCSKNNKILFDFGDIDCWHNGEQELIPADSIKLQNPWYNGPDVPREHRDFVFDGPGHTSEESCMLKGAALWQMMAILHGWEVFVNVAREDASIPGNFALEQNYPNPFNPGTKISFILPEKGYAELAIFDLSGKKVTALINKELEAGYHSTEFHAGNLPSGVYFYSIKTPKFTAVKKMLLVR